MNPFAAVEAAAEQHFLAVFGICKTTAQDDLPDGAIVLLGPAEPGFWAHITAAPEFADGRDDPLDRWSARVVDTIAEMTGGLSLLPFGKPVRPFVSWALRSGRSWSSPVGLLVHDTAGLMVSFRGAVALPGARPRGTRANRPCETCAEKPCLDACPPRALTASGYDLSRCHGFLDSNAGRVSCMATGCQVRRACPVSQSYARLPEQSAHHMRYFHP